MEILKVNDGSRIQAKRTLAEPSPSDESIGHVPSLFTKSHHFAVLFSTAIFHSIKRASIMKDCSNFKSRKQTH